MRKLPLLLAIVPLMAGASAFAANLSVTSNAVGAGHAVVASCGVDNAVSTYVTAEGGDVEEIHLSNLASECEGATIKAVLVDATGNPVSGFGQGAVTAGTAEIVLATPHVAEAATARFVITGPVTP